MDSPASHQPPPPPQGVRLAWHQVPAPVRARVAEKLGSPVIQATSQPSGFSPGVAVRLLLADRSRVFAKAIGPVPNPKSPAVHRREARVMAAMPVDAPVPPLLYAYDEGEGGWVVLVFEDIDGYNPHEPWRPEELDRVLYAMVALSTALTPSPLPRDVAGTASEAFAERLRGWQRLLDEEPSCLDALDEWSRRHLDALAAMEQQAATAVVGGRCCILTCAQTTCC